MLVSILTLISTSAIDSYPSSGNTSYSPFSVIPTIALGCTFGPNTLVLTWTIPNPVYSAGS